MICEHDFHQKLEFSLAERQKVDICTLKNVIVGCVDIEKTSTEVDRTGIDYIATLRNGAKINIDAKAREKGASRFWRYGEPELVIEIWSSMPDGTWDGTPGWTFNEASNVDYILYTFDESDCSVFYFIPFQLLRLAAIKHYDDWTEQYYRKQQFNHGYISQAIFVPASVVLAAVEEQMKIQPKGLTA